MDNLTPNLPPHVAMMRMSSGKMTSQIIYVAAELGIADLLAKREQTAEELAFATETNADALYRLLRALASLDVFVEGESRKFRNNSLSETLRRDVPGSIHGVARMMGMPMHWKAWGELLYSIKSGKSAFEHVAGEPIFEYISTRPSEAQILNDALTSSSWGVSQAVARGYDFSDARMIVDVGGGHGLLLATILEANPQANGILFDLPHVREGAQRLFAEHSLTQRVKIVSGDASESVPTGGDVYIMKHIVHDWDDERAIQFMRNCNSAMQPGNKLLLVELLLPPPGEPHFVNAKLLDLEMLIMNPAGARERTLEEYHHLYAAAGLAMTKVYPADGIYSIIEGIKEK